MEVKQEWYDTLKNGKIDEEILGACIFSCNKRAKNERDKEYELREKGEIHEANQYKKQKQKYYHTKYVLLHLIQPKCIHIMRHLTMHDEYVHVTERYYLFYQIGEFSCHQPIREEFLNQYRFLKKVDIGAMHFDGADDQELLPQEFVDYVESLVLTKKVRFVKKPVPEEKKTEAEKA